jgi:lysophospholipase L1-like esterase
VAAPGAEGRLRGALGSGLLLLGSLAVGVGLFECGLRLHHYGSLHGFSGEHSLRMPHATRGWALEPDGTSFQRTRDYGVLVRTNAQGLRDRPHAVEKAPETFRIVVLGDSFMEAYQVPLEASLPYRLQELLAARGVEVLNLGVGGYGTAQALLILEEEGLRYGPDLVVLAFYAGNDVHNNSRAIETALQGEDEPTTFARPYATATSLDGDLAWTPPDAARMAPHVERWRKRKASSLDALRRAVQPAMVAHLLERATARLWNRITAGDAYDPELAFGWPFLREVADPETARLWDEAWLATRRLLLEIDRVARAAGARFAVLIVPANFQVDGRLLAAMQADHPGLAFDPLRVNRELAAFCAGAGIPLLDPTPALAREQAAGRPMYYSIEDHHWNAAGQALSAELLAEFLDARGLLPSATSPRREAQAASTSR